MKSYVNKNVTKDEFALLGKKLVDETVRNFRLHERDTGSADIQIALLSEHINVLAERLRESRSPLSIRLELFQLIGKRRDLLNYLKSTDTIRYHNLVNRLKLRHV